MLFDETTFASGFEAGVTCAWSNGVAIVCPEPAPGAPAGDGVRMRGVAAVE